MYLRTVIWVALSLFACMLGINCATRPEPPGPTAQVEVLFDPVSASPQLPLPTDLAKDSVTGLLKIPTAANASAAQKSFNAYLNTLNGYPSSVTPEVKFSGELLPASVNDQTIKVFDATDAYPIPVEGLLFQYLTVQETDPTTQKPVKRGLVRIFNDAGWKRERLYVIYVMGGTGGVLDPSNKPIRPSSLFRLVTGSSPLCDYAMDKTFEPSSNTCETPGQGRVAAGCCQLSTSFDLDQFTRQLVLGRYPSSALPSASELDQEVLTETLAKGSTLEKIRLGYSQLIRLGLAAGLNTTQIAMVWNFSTARVNEAIFEPTGSSPELPLPTDLLRDEQTGLLNVPVAAGANDAEKGFTTYLNSLNGWSLSSAQTATIKFSAAIEPSSVDKGLKLFRLEGGQLIELIDAERSYDPNTGTASIKMKQGPQPNTTYVALALSGPTGIRNAAQTTRPGPYRSATMELVTSPHPLCTCQGKICKLQDGEVCDQVSLSSFVDDPKEKPNGLTAIDKAMLFEKVRQQYNPLLLKLEEKGQLKREELLACWSFTTMSMAEISFDPTTGVIPFPNNLLLDPKTGKVNVPASPKETDAQKALREGLNNLDGFSTLGSVYATYTGQIAPESLKLGESVFIVDVKTGKLSTDWKVELVESAPAIVATPTKPLNEKQTYAIVLVSKGEAGSLKATGGLKDKEGRRIVPSPFMALLRSPTPLVKEGKSTVSLLNDATASQAEAARLSLEPLFAVLDREKIQRQHVVAAWAFTTQTITEPLTKLRAVVWKKLKQEDNNAPTWKGNLTFSFTGFIPGVPRDQIFAWAPNASFTSWNALDTKGTGALLPNPEEGQSQTIPMAIFIPKQTMPAAGYPVVIFQHGLGRAKEDATVLANTMAEAGFATIAFDAPYHGDLTVCTLDEHCQSKKCDAQTGQCQGGGGFVDTQGYGVPDASGAAFVRVDNIFATRDNVRQYVMHAVALLRGITLGAASGILDTSNKPNKIRLDANKVYFVGQSLGGIMGPLVMAVDSLPKRAIFNVPGAPIISLMYESTRFKPVIEAALQAQGVKDGTLDYLRTKAIFHWIVDPADPANFGKYVVQESLKDLVTNKAVSTKQVMLMIAGKDTTVPPAFGRYLANSIGIPESELLRSTYPEQAHTFLLLPDPAGTISATFAAQKQAAHFLLTGKVCTPDTNAGTCQ